MPDLLNDVTFRDGNFDVRRYKYDYPGGKDLRPNSKLHQKIVERILSRATVSWTTMQERHPVWDRISDSLVTYIRIDKSEEEVQDDDDRRPVSIVVPQSLATMDTIITYLLGAFFSEHPFHYKGYGPEDIPGNVLLEKAVELQVIRFKAALAMHTWWRDAIAFGIGGVSINWRQVIQRQQITEERGIFNSTLNRVFRREPKVRFSNVVAYEGNELENIDPYAYLPDPNVAAHKIQDAEFVGWVSRSNRMDLLERERSDPGTFFNAKYLKHLTDGFSKYHRDPQQKRSSFNIGSNQSKALDDTNPMDTIFMYVNLIPQEWELGPEDHPVKWMFALTGDQILTAAAPMNLDHNMYPVAIIAPDYDGYSATPLSRIESIIGMQDALNFLWNSHVANVRKTINNELIVDPSRIIMDDLTNPKAGGIIRLNKLGWGKGVKDAVEQLKVSDVTRGNVGDMETMIAFMERTSAAQENLQGVSRRGGPERKTATESRSSTGSAISRLDKIAQIISLQGMMPLGFMYASQTQQLMSQDVYLQTVGNWPENIAKEYGIDNGFVTLRPDDLNIMYDVVPYDNTQRGAEFVETWLQLMQIAATSDQLGPSVKQEELFRHIARLMGAHGIDAFIRSPGEAQRMRIQQQVLPNAEVQDLVAAGNAIPAAQFEGVA